MRDYHINIFYSDEDEAYVADIPDLPGCSSFGETPESALREVETAKAAWLDVRRQSNQDVPLPSYRPLIYQMPMPDSPAASPKS